MEGWRFDGAGIKYFHPGSARERLADKLYRMRAAAVDEEAESGRCMRCGQLAAMAWRKSGTQSIVNPGRRRRMEAAMPSGVKLTPARL